MKHLFCSLLFTGLFALTLAGTSNPNLEVSALQSIHAMTFSSEGVLFVGDSKAATIFAFETSEASSREVQDVNVEEIDILIADALGTTVDRMVIQDMAVHPLSKSIYLGVHLNDGTPILMRYTDRLEAIDLKDLKSTSMTIPNSVAMDAEDRRGRSLRKWTVSDINYHDGHVLISGLTNQEFASTLTQIPYPFREDHSGQASLEIYHAAHGKFETHSPIKTFTTATINNEPHVIASYTCTPLVVFPLSDLQEGKHVKGRTVAELGNRNTPLDMVLLEKNGDQYLLMSNSSRAVMKIKLTNIEQYAGTLTEPVDENSGVAGIEFLSLPMTNVQQMDKLDDSRVVVIQRKANGQLDLNTQSSNRLL